MAHLQLYYDESYLTWPIDVRHGLIFKWNSMMLFWDYNFSQNMIFKAKSF